MNKWSSPLLGILVLLLVQSTYAQDIRVGPDGEFSQQTLTVLAGFGLRHSKRADVEAGDYGPASILADLESG